jgi:hypothetical protein
MLCEVAWNATECCCQVRAVLIRLLPLSSLQLPRNVYAADSGCVGARSAISRAVATKVSLFHSHAGGQSSREMRSALQCTNTRKKLLYLLQEMGHRKGSVHYVNVLAS